MIENPSANHNDFEKEYQGKMQKRIEEMLPGQSELPTPLNLHEVEELKARIIELEEKLKSASFEHDTSSSALWKDEVPSNKENSATGFWGKLLAILRPPVFGDISKDRVAALENTILWALAGAILFQFLLANDLPSVILLVSMAVFVGVIFFVFRRGHVDLVAWLVVLLVIASSIFAYIVYGFSGNTIVSAAVVLALSNFLIRRPWQALVANVIVVTLLGYSSYLSLQFVEALSVISSSAVLGLVLTYVAYQIAGSFKQLDVTANSLRFTNRDLQEKADALTQRTRELNLAAEAAQNITQQLGNTNEMLANAVEMIRKNFDLYYTQIYLTDPSGRSIVLRSGTGEAGKELLARGHRLLISSKSSNGRAVLEKRAVLVEDTAASESFFPNPLLPKTRSELVMPLMISNQVIGTLDMQSEKPNAFNRDNLAAFEALTGQVAVAVQNANLLEQSEQARREVEENVKSLTQSGWQNLMDAIEVKDKIGYAYRAGSLTPAQETMLAPTSENVFSLPIEVAGAKVGFIQALNEEHPFEEQDSNIVKATVAQLARHIDGLRLLAQATKYRREAEEAARRLTREGWEAFIKDQKAIGSGFEYKQNEVLPLSERANGSAAKAALVQPIAIRDEVIGELEVDIPEESSEDAKRLIATVSRQLSDHVESLRLLEQAEQRRIAMQEGEARLRTLVENAPEAIVVIEMSTGLFVEPNENAVRLYGLSREELVKVGPADMSPSNQPDGRPSTEKAMEKINEAMSGGTPVFEWMHRNAQGEDIPCEIRLVRLPGERPQVRASITDISDRKKAQQALEEGEARLRTLIEHAPEAVFVVNLETGLFEQPNDNALKLFGLTPEKFSHSNPMTISPLNQPDGELSETKANTVLARAMNGEAPVFEWIAINPSGEEIPCEVRLVKLPGSRPLVRVSMADISERKKTEAEILFQKSMLESQSESSIDGILVVSPENKIISFNKRFVEMWNVPQEVIDSKSDEAALGSVLNELVNPDEFIAKVGYLYEHRDEKAQDEIALKDGRTFDRFTAPVRGSEDTYFGRVWFFRDVTETKRAQASIARRAVELATVANVSTTASTVLDPDKLLQSVVDLTKERFRLYHVHIYLLEDKTNLLNLASGAGNIGAEMVSNGYSIPLDADVSLVARSARERHAIIVNDVRAELDFLPNPLLPETRSEMAVPMIVGDRVLGVFDVQSDTAKYFTDEDANIYAALAAQVAVALQNARLFTEIEETAERLKEIDRMKSEFLANMSHELRTPLNSVIGYAEILLTGIDGDLDDEKQADVQAIFDNAKHLLSLINDVLDLAKIEAGRLVLKKENVKIAELIENVKNNSYGMIHALKKSVETVTAIDANLPVIFVDPVRISQVLNNLVSNAIKFSDKGTISIRAFQEGEWLTVEVEDEGVGIAQSDISKIFERFSQVDGSTTRRVEGTGLGLPISYHLIEMHGGSMKVESEIGRGSKFTIQLPFSLELAAA